MLIKLLFYNNRNENSFLVYRFIPSVEYSALNSKLLSILMFWLSSEPVPQAPTGHNQILLV